MVAKEQQSQPLASQSPPAWASHTEHMMTDSSEGGKQPHDDTAEAIVADYYGSYSNSPQSQNSSNNSLLTLSPRSSTSQASNPGLDFTKNMKYNNNTAAQDQLKDANMNIALNLDSGNKKSSRVRKATPSKCAAAAAVNGGSGGSSAASSARSLSTLKCQLCSFTTQSRLNFSEHLGTHCSNLCETDADEFTKLVLEQLNGNLGANDDLASPAKKSNINNNNNNNTISNNNNNNNNNSLDIPVYDQSGDELGLRVPRVSAQGKVKLFRCKQCPYVAIVKVDFWDHSRQHIKPEKLLTCPKCPFVTEYKHHLEYHLRNHFGSKPFKCEQCDYSCVNKSMLNSHLKSHSDVYQFRCNECAYATKYCHSLKLHLRKYDHTPSVVLNTDGTPNPLPIVDVYGTRRGPKTKSDDTTPPPQDIVSVILPTVVNKLQPARQKQQQQQQQQQQQHRQSHTPPQQPSSPGSMQPAVHSPQYNFGSQSSPDSSFGRFNSPIGGPAAPQLPITPASSPKSPAEASYMNQGAAATIHLLSSLGGSGSFNPYAAAAAMQASSQVAETSSRAGLRRELRQLTSITNPAFLGSTEMAQRVMSLTLSILAEGVKNAESLAAAASNEREKDNNSDNSSSTDTASSQDAVAVSSSLPLDLSKASKNCCEAQDLTKNRPTYDNEDNDDDGARTADDDYDDAEDDEDDVAGEPPAPELEAIVATLCKRKRVMRSVHGSLSFLRQYLMFLRAAQLQSLCYM